jgi:hypothetical protein
MKEFHKQAMNLVKEAVYQDKPFIVLSHSNNELTCAYTGNQNQLVKALEQAISNDSDLYTIVKRAVQSKDARDIEPRVLRFEKEAV